jgi:two-component system, sensor histidine kinase and response regulator
MTDIYTILDNIQHAYSTSVPSEIFQCIIQQFTDYTKSQIGFLATSYEIAGSPRLRLRAWVGVELNDEADYKIKEVLPAPELNDSTSSNLTYNSEDEEQYFHEQNSLIKKIFKTGHYVIDNHISNEDQNIPSGHPQVVRFMGLPLKIRDRVVGIIGLGNRKKRYRSKMTQELSSVLVYSAITVGCILRERKFLNVKSKYKQLRNVQKLSTARYRAVVDNAIDAIIIMDSKGVIEHFNESAARLFGWEAGELVGQNITTLMPQQYAKQHAELLENTQDMLKCTTATHGSRRSQMIRKDKTDIFVDVGVFNMGDASYGAIIRDAEDAIKREKEVQRDAEEKSRFLANMSHEIRTPLNGILGMTTLLSKTTLNTAQSEYLSIIKQSGENLMIIINDILDMSKLEANKLSINIEPISIQSCVENAFDILSSRAEEKKLEFRYNIDSNIPESLLGDQHRITQILINLLTNAIKFTEKGSVKLNVGVKDIKQNNQNESRIFTFVFSIIDTGIGISKESQDKLFQPFTQVDQTNTRVYQGSGLGLAISKQLAKLMQGDVWIHKSKEKAGTTFKFSIQLTENIHFISEKSLSQLKGKKILVVDDNQTNILWLCGVLISWGMEPISCTSAEVAMIYIRNNYKFDLGLIDICMPKTGGMELAAKIHDEQDIPLIAVSSISVLDVDLTHFKNIIAKPVGEQKLYKVIMDVLSDTSGDLEQKNINSSTIRRHNETSPNGKINILVAEDNDANQKVISGMLQYLGYKNITIVNNGECAVSQALSTRYDVILMDIKMPIMNGYEAAKIINKKLTPRPPIIALTANAMKGAREDYLYKGYMDEYITKPIDINELSKKIGQIIG